MESLMSISSWVRSSSCAAISADIRPVEGAELVLALLPLSRDCDVRAEMELFKLHPSSSQGLYTWSHVGQRGPGWPGGRGVGPAPHVHRVPAPPGGGCLVTIKAAPLGSSGASWPQADAAPHLECSVRWSVIVGHEEFVEPLHELKVILESSLHKSVHLHGFVDVKLGKCGLKQFKILNVFVF